uniref:Leucine-rich repeat protein n=1 Tax=Paramoeba aestuarina TaxID=180227 RepID=A0A7S4KSH7_9EUKA|mmetsp:Transcript_24038/g.37443  ORF Transcript_24038/g.37443 Transcript_24038/m.37443 type:complete len:215 (+) Transcript_24038:21-665(+)
MKFPFSLLANGADPSVMRVDKSSVPQLSLMDLLIDGLDPKRRIRPETSSSLDNWSRIKLTPAGDVTDIEFSNKDLTGSLQLEWMPSTVQSVDVSYNAISGTLNLESLPVSLCRIDLGNNAFEGTVCLTNLPRELKELILSINQLSGQVDLTKLPEGLHRLQLHRNMFEGWTDFSQLPESLEFLSVSETGLSGMMVVSRGRSFQVYDSKVKVIYE